MSALSLLQRASERLAVALMLTLFATVAFASGPSDTTAQQPSYWHPWFEIGGYHNSRDDDSTDSTGTSGTNRGETTIFAPIRGGQRHLLFSQLTAKFFDDSAKEGNFALGYRRMTTSGFNLGAWIGADVRRSEIGNNFWQLSGGFEALSDKFDARINWYGPITEPQAGVAGYAQVQLQGSQIFMTGGEEVGLMGVDGEIGVRLPSGFAGLDPNIFELRAYAGGYRFYSDDAEDNVTGVKGRLEFRINDVIASLPGSRLTAEYEVTHDDVRDTRHDVGLRVRIPLNGGQSAARSLASLSGQQRRMLDGIERDTDIVTGRSKREGVEDALTGTAFDRVAYATTEVTTTANTSGDNSLIILNGTVKGSQDIQSNQTLQGGGSTIQVRGRRSGTVVPFTAPGAAGRLEEPTTNEYNLRLDGSGIHVTGIAVVGNADPVNQIGDEGVGVILGDNNKNIFLTNLRISKTIDPGIQAGDSNEVTIRNIAVNDVSSDAIAFNDDNTVVIDGVTISGSEGGLVFADSNYVTIRNATISDINGIGIDFDNDNEAIRISDTSITGSGFHGIRLGSRNIEIGISNTQITDTNGRNGIQFSQDNTNIMISNVTISGNVDDAIELGRLSVAVVSGLHVNGANYGIRLVGQSANVAVSNSAFSNIGQYVFDSTNTDGSWIVRDSVIDGAGNGVFRIKARDKLLFADNTITGLIGGNVFSFEGADAEILAGSTGNDMSGATFASGGQVCAVSGAFTFSGSTIEFVDGVTVVSPPTC